MIILALSMLLVVVVILGIAIRAFKETDLTELAEIDEWFYRLKDTA